MPEPEVVLAIYPKESEIPPRVFTGQAAAAAAEIAITTEIALVEMRRISDKANQRGAADASDSARLHQPEPPPDHNLYGRVTGIKQMGRVATVEVNSSDDGTGRETCIFIRRSRFADEYHSIVQGISVGDVVWAQGLHTTAASGRPSFEPDKIRVVAKAPPAPSAAAA